MNTNSTQAKSAKNSLKINGVEHPLSTGGTSLVNIDVLFHAIKSTQVDPKTCRHFIEGASTDEIYRLQNIVGSLQMWANSGTGVIGELLAYADIKEISGSCVSDTGWLLVGFSELQMLLTEAAITLEEAERHISTKKSE